MPNDSATSARMLFLDVMEKARVFSLLGTLFIASAATCETHAKVEVIEQAPATTYYTTRVEKVPNTNKYPKYKPPVVTKVFQHELPKRPPMMLTGKVGEDDDLDDGVNRGVGPVADGLLKNAPTLGEVRKIRLDGNVFRTWMQKNWPKLDVTQLKPGDTVVIKGRYDHAERILDNCRIPYVTGDNGNIASRLQHATLLVINCPGDLSDNSIEIIRAYLQRGGNLLTTDWSLGGCLQKICPGFVYWDGAYSRNEIVDGNIVTPENPLVINAPSPAPWKLDDKSQLIKPGARRTLQVLARSKTLSHEDTVGLGVLAVTFDYGRGHVLHQVGHVDNNTDLASNSVLPDPSQKVLISLRQVISLNFIANALMHK